MTKSFRSAYVSGIDQKAQTPKCMLDVISKLYFLKRRVYDPCPHNHKFDGLTSNWQKHNFINPPFDEIPLWVKKAIQERSRNCHSVFLLPVRSSTKYLHDLILPQATSIIFWMNPVAFPPFKTKLAIPIMTVEFGASSYNPSNTVRIWKVQLRSYRLYTQGSIESNLYNDQLMPRLREDFGPYEYEHHCTTEHVPLHLNKWKLIPDSTNYVCVMNGPKEAILHMIDFLNKHPRTTIIAVVMPFFNSAYFRSLVQKEVVKELLLISPYLNFNASNTSRSFVASVGLVLTRKAYQPKTRSMPEAAFGQWMDGRIFRDYV